MNFQMSSTSNVHGVWQVSPEVTAVRLLSAVVLLRLLSNEGGECLTNLFDEMETKMKKDMMVQLTIFYRSLQCPCPNMLVSCTRPRV